MTNPLFRDDSYKKSCSARVTSSGPGWIETDTTVFYARSGGQPGDQGVITAGSQQFTINDTTYCPQRTHIRHFLADEQLNLLPGTDVTLEIDWSRRYRLMRMHSAMHLLCAVVPAPVTGGGVGESESRVEFDIQTTDFDKDSLSQRLNQFILDRLAVEISEIDESELDRRPELIRTMSVQPPRGAGSIRMVRIGDGVDYQPCGGTHVANTSEIGEVRITGIKSKGKKNKRFTLALTHP